MAKSQHVIPGKNGGWSVKKSGAVRASKSFSDKNDAVKFAREVSKNQKTELYIHKKDGTIQRKDSHGSDPVPPRDRDTHK